MDRIEQKVSASLTIRVRRADGSTDERTVAAQVVEADQDATEESREDGPQCPPC